MNHRESVHRIASLPRHLIYPDGPVSGRHRHQRLVFGSSKPRFARKEEPGNDHLGPWLSECH